MLSKSALLVAVLVLNLPSPLQAHDIYSHLVDAAGRSCCDDRDCRPVPYRMTAGGVTMLIDERWIDVPEETIQYRALLDDARRDRGWPLVRFCPYATQCRRCRAGLHDAMCDPAASGCVDPGRVAWFVRTVSCQGCLDKALPGSRLGRRPARSRADGHLCREGTLHGGRRQRGAEAGHRVLPGVGARSKSMPWPIASAARSPTC